MQPFSGNQRPDLLTALMNMSLVLRLPRKMHLCRCSSNVPRLPSFLEMLQNLHVLLIFHLQMCFTPPRHTLFRHRNFQKWSEPGVFCTFWHGNVLRATTACNFSSLIWPDGSAPAALASLPFDPLEPQIIGKTQRFATFLPFRAPASSFFWLFLFSGLLSSALLFSFLLLHLCFLSVHIVGSLTSKLPSVTSPLDPMKIPSNHHDSYWLVVWNRNFIFPIILGMSSSQLTNSIIFQRGRLNHQPVYMFGEFWGDIWEKHWNNRVD